MITERRRETHVDATTDELTRTDEAFTGNHLLSTLPPEARELLEPFGTVVELDTGETALSPGEQVTSSLFPIGPTLISLEIELSGGRTVEAVMIGLRGAVGGIVSCGQAPAFSRALVLVGGPAFKVPMEALEKAKQRSPFIANLFCRYSDYLLAQAMQGVACNAYHSIPERAARWLLHALDRTGERIELTQQALAGLLGVQRTTINAVLQSFEQDGVISTGRGVVQVNDRGGLKRRSCECYDRLEEHFAAIVGTSGRGGGA
jgi:hypothetical protein